MIASSTVRPALECTSASLAASTSPIRSVKPITLRRGSPAKRLVTRARSLSLRPHRHSTVAPGDGAARRGRADEVANAPASARDGDHLALGRQAERAPGVPARPRRQECWRGRRLGPPDAARSGDLLHLLGRLRVGDEVQVDPGMRPEMQPGQIGDRGIAGTSRRPVRRSSPSTAVTPGYVETIWSGSWARISRIRPRRPKAVSSRRASHLVGAKFMNSRYWRSNHQGTHRNMNAEFSRSSLRQDGAHRGQPVDDRDLRVGILVLELARDRSRRQIVPLADVGGDDQDVPGARLGVGLAGRDHRGRLLIGGLRGLLAPPVDVPAHALGERRRGGPPELALGPRAADHLAAEVSGPCRRVDDLDVADQLLDGLGDLLDRDVLVAGEVVHAVARDVVEPARDAVGEVLDVHEPARLAAVAGERQRLAARTPC